MTTSPSVTGSGVLLRGSFNPAIFHPSWFAREGLISEKEADTAKINIIHSQVASFETDGFRLQVTSDSFDVTAEGRPFSDLVRDIAYGTFTLLRHTPISMMGINNFAHFQAPSETAWHNIGHSFAPKQFWNPLLKDPGMQSLTIRGQRKDEYMGYVDVRVEPSVMIMPTGVFVNVNDHVQLAEDETKEGAAALMEILQGNWSAAVENAQLVINAVKEEAT
jgi:hypothetical protein